MAAEGAGGGRGSGSMVASLAKKDVLGSGGSLGRRVTPACWAWGGGDRTWIGCSALSASFFFTDRLKRLLLSSSSTMSVSFTMLGARGEIGGDPGSK